ncbi:hypothetical protein C7974DRAFT_424623 [Boeremia exigua]|uniref:uncharacterized protein n=1 Tax=Boeremia exigua TaxID=749465 RepID=UPI001E8D13BC|nr:uncharacterized protein C7974DRAFT_424623 [Boeremia exigua]KAH6629607.1 hypothetical protein C7974DRAFT_424623 [Boeremia exigua]
MLLPEEDADVFKRWVLPKLETISDADAEVLADYVVALVTTKDTDASIRRNCLESLSDFLQDNTAPFVDEVIRTLKSKGYAPGTSTSASASASATAPIPSIVGTSTAEYLPHPHASTAPLHAPKGPAASRHRLPDRPTGASAQPASRKRKQNERDASQARDNGDRPAKQTARRGKNGRGLNAHAPAFAPMPPFNPGFGDVPPFDPGNPMAFLAMAAAFGVNLPGMPGLSSLDAHGAPIRCADYDTKGYCAAGSLCPYSHGLDYEVDGPAPAHARPDAPSSTLVLDNIPAAHFSEPAIRAFFAPFGALTSITLHPPRLALLSYADPDAARAAHTSPKPIFDNRFVTLTYPPSTDRPADAVPQETPEEAATRLAAAQAAFESRRAKFEAAEAAAADIERKLQHTNAEIARVRRQIAGVAGAEDAGDDLAVLQAEAATLFAQQDAAHQDAAHWHAAGPGAGADRAAGGGVYGRPYARPRGAFRGRGGPRTGVRRLDNRPRGVVVKGVEAGSARDEGVRVVLLNTPGVVATHVHPSQPDALVVGFAERYQAEAFIDTAHNHPSLGPLDMEWAPNELFADARGAHASTSQSTAAGAATDQTAGGVTGRDGKRGADGRRDGSPASSAGTLGADAEAGGVGEADGGVDDADVDMDVAEDEDRWL